ncbi:MAG: M28 family peptidase [Planctomycetota bacterium]
MAPILINADRVVAELDQLAAYSDTPAPAVTRVMLSQQDLAARAWLTTLMQDAGLATRVDAAGNLFARWLGQEEGLPAVATGSHCDAIPHSGKYDGTLGVVGAVEAVRALGASGWRPRRSIDVVMFTSEEPTRYGVGCLGSRPEVVDVGGDAGHGDVSPWVGWFVVRRVRRRCRGPRGP